MNITEVFKLNTTYSLKDLVNRLQLSSENPREVVDLMMSNGEREHIITIYSSKDLNIPFKHALATIVRKVDNNNWEGIVTTSTMGNTQPIHISRKHFKIVIDGNSHDYQMHEVQMNF